MEGIAWPKKNGICRLPGSGTQHWQIGSCPSSSLPKTTQFKFSLDHSSSLWAAIPHGSSGCMSMRFFVYLSIKWMPGFLAFFSHWKRWNSLWFFCADTTYVPLPCSGPMGWETWLLWGELCSWDRPPDFQPLHLGERGQPFLHLLLSCQSQCGFSVYP